MPTRGLLTALLLLGALGVAAELVLLDHWATPTQAAPFGALAAAVVAGGLTLRRAPAPGPSTVAFDAAMAALVLGGLVGVGLHYYANVAFEREMDPDAEVLTLAWKALRGGVPVLAPGAFVQLGLLGLILNRFTTARAGASQL